MTEIANGEWNLPVYKGLSNRLFGVDFTYKSVFFAKFEYFL